MIWILGSIVFSILIYLTLVKPFNYWKEKGVPQYNLWKIWLEIMKDVVQYENVAKRTQKVFSDFSNTRYYGIYKLLGPTLIIKDPDLIKQITVKDFDHFTDHSNFIPNESDPLWKTNLFFLNGNQWKNMRKLASSTFTSSKMKVMFELMSECTEKFVQHFSEQGTNTIHVEMKDIFTRYTNDVNATVALGVTCDSFRHKDNEFYLMGKKATEFGGGLWDSLKVFFIIICPGLAKIFDWKIAQKTTSDYFRNVIRSNIKAREENGIVRPDVIHFLLEARKNRQKVEKLMKDLADSNKTQQKENEEQMSVSNDDIAAQVFIYFLAGFDSVATLMCFMAYELALNLDIQQRLQREIDDFQIKCGNTLTYDKLSRLGYMDMVISETLRKWPNAIVLHRICVKPYTILPTRKKEKPVHLDKGDIIWFPLFGIQRDPENYPEPDRFDPERFSEENKSNINPYVYLPFGIGPRVCIGTKFALIETKLVFFYLLSKFDIAVTERTRIPLELDRSLFQLNCADGFWLGLKPREMLC